MEGVIRFGLTLLIAMTSLVLASAETATAAAPALNAGQGASNAASHTPALDGLPAHLDSRESPLDGGFQFSLWASFTGGASLEFMSGDFTGADEDDLLYYNTANGQVFVAPSNGTQFIAGTLWTTLDASTAGQLIVGDFAAADGKADLAVYYPSTGKIFVGKNNGAGFAFDPLPWATVFPAAGWKFTGSDFTLDLFADLAGYFPGDGSVWVGRNDTGTFQFGPGPWYTVSPSADWQFVPGDFDADGKPDLGGYHPSNDSIWNLRNTGSAFAPTQLASVSDSPWSILGGQFVAGGRSEFLATVDDGNLWVGTYDPLCDWPFLFSLAGAVSPPSGWIYRSGDFDDDGVTDVAAYSGGTGGMWVSINQGWVKPAAGYAWPLSAAPGGTIDFHASGITTGNVTFYRHIADAAGVHSFAMGSTRYTPAVQGTNNHPERNGAGWSVSFAKSIPDAWPSGLYSAKITGLGGDVGYIPFVVKPKPTRRSDVAVLANVNTWLAYNGWGCGGKYDGKASVSFLRPNLAADPVSGADHLTRGELWTLGWLEQAGYAPDVYTDLDFHDGGLPNGYRALVLTTHPEYWSSTMMGKLRTYLSGGGSLLYLGGNGLFERGAYYADKTGMSFREGVEGGPRENAIFRRLAAPDPERAILGVATEACGVAGAPYAVRAGMAGHFAFQGTGLGDGSTFGANGLSSYGGGGASGWETDTSAGPGAQGIPSACAMGSAAAYPVPAYPPLPAGFVVLAKGTNPAGVGGEMTYYPHPGGGLVFSVGSLNFSGSLPVDDALQRIVHNILAKTGASRTLRLYLPAISR